MPTNSATSLSKAHIPALDGVRGVAIALVMLFHMNVMTPATRIDRAWNALATHAGVGVDVFFVLSGFLITGILLDAKGTAHFFRNFYARRVLRIFPLYYATAAFCLLILPHLRGFESAEFQSATSDAVYYWLYLSNFAVAMRGKFVGMLDISWSLAIEEQFYLVWPLLVWMFSPRSLRWICVGLVLASCVARLVMLTSGFGEIVVYTVTYCRMDGLAMGALVAMAVRGPNVMRWRRLMHWIGSAALVLFLSLGLMSHRPWASLLVSGHALAALCTAAMILLAATNSVRWLSAVLSVSLLRKLGKYSYAIYMFHHPLMVIIRDHVFGPAQFPTFLGSPLPGQILFILICSGVAFAVAWLSWNLFEKHFLKLKRFFEQAPPKPSAVAKP